MARLAGINIPDNKHAEISLTYIYGIGRTTAKELCATTGVSPTAKVQDLSEAELDKLRAEIGKISVEGDLRREIQLNIKRLLDLGCNRGIRIVETCRCEARIQRTTPGPVKVRSVLLENSQ